MRSARQNLSLLYLATGLFAQACTAEPHQGDFLAPPPSITQIESASPLLEGSRVHVIGASFDHLYSPPTLECTDRTTNEAVTLQQNGDTAENELFFNVDAHVLIGLASGHHTLDCVVTGGREPSAPYAWDFELADTMNVALFETPQGFVHFNDAVVLSGNGFVTSEEGSILAHVTGTFTSSEGGSRDVDTEIRVEPAEEFARDRGVFQLTTGLGGPEPGSFEGTVSLSLTLRGGQTSQSEAMALILDFGPPAIDLMDPPEAAYEQYVSFTGAGFLGANSDESTLVRLLGTFTEPDGTTRPVEAELVPEWRSGHEVRFSLATEQRGDRLYASLFHSRRGIFEGMATPVISVGPWTYEGPAAPVSLTLTGMKQIVVFHFLDGYSQALEYYGLANVDKELREGILRRFMDIYRDYAVEARFDVPTDYSRNGYTLIEIGGVDPSGKGNAGLDASVGKDLGNLRMFDRIGGANAEHQMDGTNGYGGVFIEAFLFFTSHPDPTWPAPRNLPPPQALFDEVFDPVRNRAATTEEAMGQGSASRVTQVQRAMRAFENMIGENVSHEFGHSLGLAQPNDPDPRHSHSATPGDGCLMDEGKDRPLSERFAEPQSTTHFCGDEPAYLEDILGRW